MKIRQWLRLAAAGLLLTLSACSSKTTEALSTPKSASTNPRELIVGKWQRTDAGKDKEILELTSDGKITGGEPGFGFEGKYKFVDDATIEYDVKPAFGAYQYAKGTVKVGKDELTLDVKDAKSRLQESEAWREEADDKSRKGQTQKYKRLP